MSMFQRLSQLLGVREDQVDDALKSEQRARRQLTRRGLLAAGAAIIGGQLLPSAERVWSLPEAGIANNFALWSEVRLDLMGGVWQVAYIWKKAAEVSLQLGGLALGLTEESP